MAEEFFNGVQPIEHKVKSLTFSSKSSSFWMEHIALKHISTQLLSYKLGR